MAAVLLASICGSVIACPTGWAALNTNSTSGAARCLLVPPEHSMSLFYCVEVCEQHGGVPACIRSAAENDVVMTELAPGTEGLWLGLYQNETALGTTHGWGRCVAAPGDAPSFSNWKAKQPNDWAGFQEDCTRFDVMT